MDRRALPWLEHAWQQEASGWIRSEIEHHGLSLNGEIEQPHVRPWSTVMRVRTDGGILYFKAAAPVLGHEPALTDFLARSAPERMPDLLATDLSRGWLLMRDSGTPLRTFIRGERSFHFWESALPSFAELQIRMVTRTRELLSLGTPDRRLDTLPAQFEELVADREAMLIGQEHGLEPEAYVRLRGLVSVFAGMCARLAGFGIPESLHHDDFHDANVFVRDGRAIFTDWGEACVAHPFFSLLVMLRSVDNSLDINEYDPALDGLRDLYLRSWTEYASLDELKKAFTLARRIAMVNRALTWHRVIHSMDAGLQPEYADAVPGWLGEFLSVME